MTWELWDDHLAISRGINRWEVPIIIGTSVAHAGSLASVIGLLGVLLRGCAGAQTTFKTAIDLVLLWRPCSSSAICCTATTRFVLEKAIILFLSSELNFDLFYPFLPRMQQRK
jgi:hypothetical protein